MSTYNDGPDVSYPAAADYSSTGQLRCMALNSSDQAVLATARGQAVAGILQDDPDAAGRAGTVRIYGTSKAVTGGAYGAWDPLTTDSSGRLVEANLPTDYVLARAAEASTAAGTIKEVVITHEGHKVGLKAWVEDFNALDTTDQVANIQPDGTAADGTGDVLNHCYTPGGHVLGYEALGTQTITGPVIVANGLDIGGDQTDDDGYEVFSHFLGATGAPFVIGKDPAFYFLLKLEVTDISGTDDLQVGFRRAEICRPNFDDYLDAAAFSVDVADGTLSLETILNNGATTTTDTTDSVTDAVAVQFKILVSAAGVVTYQHDIASAGTLAAPTTVAAFTFDNGDPVIPFVRHLQDTALTDNVIIHSWEAGYQIG